MDVYSQEEGIKRLWLEYDKLKHYASYVAEIVQSYGGSVDELNKLFEEFKESGFNEYYKEQIIAWIDEHLQYIFEVAVKHVYFGLNDDGRFVAYIPESWNDIVFDTGADYALDTYGRLILRFDVDSPDNVDQTSEIVRPYSDKELEDKVRNIMNTLYNSGKVGA